MTKATCAASLAADQNVFAHRVTHAHTVADHIDACILDQSATPVKVFEAMTRMTDHRVTRMLGWQGKLSCWRGSAS